MAGVALDVTYRPLQPSDLAAVMEIEERSFTQPWSESLFTAEIAQPSRRYLAADAAGALRGYGGIMMVGEEATIVTLAVQPDWRERGVASRLLLALIDLARAAGVRHLTLEVRESNHVALDLYAKFGFQSAGTRKGYYATEDAVIMWAVDIDSAEYDATLAAIRKETS